MASNIQKRSSLVKEDSSDSLMKYVKYWYVFVISILICLGIAYLYIANSQRVYKVTSTLLIQNDFKGTGVLKGTAFSDLEMFHSARTVENEMEVLRSKDLIYQTLKKLHLETAYTIEGRFSDKDLYGDDLPINVVVYDLRDKAYLQKLNLTIIDENSFVLENKGEKVRYNFNQLVGGPGYTFEVIKTPTFKAHYPTINIRFQDLHALAEHYSLSALTVLPIVKDANTVILSLLETSPQRGVDILNGLIEAYNAENVDNQNLVARNTISFIDQRLDDLDGELSRVEQGVENYKQANRITSLSADADISLSTSGSYDHDLANAQLQLDLIKSLAQYLEQDIHEYDIVPSTLGIKDITLTNLINRYNDMVIDRQRLLRNNRPNNPLIENVNEQLAALRSSLQENLRNVQTGLVLEQNNLLRKANQYESMVRNVPAVERGLLELTREQSVKTNVYQYLLQKREETALSLSATVPTSQVVDRPAPNSIPARPKSMLIYLGSLLAGFILPLSFLYGKEKLNNKVQDATEVQLLGETRILGELSHKPDKNIVVMGKGTRTTISELFRYIRTNLGYVNNNSKSQVLLVTSGMKGEGKTFFTINLGITLAMIQRKVIIVEFDLRKPDLLKGINMRYEKGLSDYLSGDQIDLNQLIKPSTESPNLFVLGCGKLPDDPSELLISDKIASMFKLLREKFDYIIVDTSPVGQVADAFNLEPYTDASIYLIRYNFTKKIQLAVLDDICENNKLKNLMIVFNDAKKENMKSYGYGGGGSGYTYA
ncbi:MAG TPA: polysaccharide biosynthesis tyrosine autokinase [Pelobium sp.]|nr:polysaccharide biosynthesis tyrosine autokinase [Pelobium sp.]